jgi:hypothetical protein
MPLLGVLWCLRSAVGRRRLLGNGRSAPVIAECAAVINNACDWLGAVGPLSGLNLVWSVWSLVGLPGLSDGL